MIIPRGGVIGCLLGAVVMSVGLSQDMADLTKLKERLDVIQTEADKKNIDIFEYPALLKNIPEYNALEAQAPGTWREALANLPRIAPSAPSQRVLFESMQTLDGKSYLEFLNRAADLYERKEISTLVFRGALTPSGRMQAFLADNYKHPEVKKMLERAKRLFADDPQRVQSLDAIISGRSKAMLDEYRKAHTHLKHEGPVEVKLDASTSTGALAGQAETPEPSSSTPAQSTTMPTPTSASSTPGAVDTPAVAVERRRAVWPWVVAILALIAMISVALKRRR